MTTLSTCGGRAPMRCLRMAGLLLLATGCHNPEHPLVTANMRGRVRSIETVSLEQESTAPPVTVEDAERQIDVLDNKREQPVQTVSVTIEQVRQAALANNLDLKVELISPAIAEEAVGEEEARFEPTFLGSVEAAKTDLSDTAAGTSSQTESLKGEAAIQIPLRTGGLATISSSATSLEADLADVPESYESALAFSVSQPLLRDAGVKVNTAPITIAKLLSQQTGARTKLEAIRILADAERAYWRHYATWREVEIRHQQYELAIEQLDDARRLANDGVVANIEIARAEVGVSRRVAAIIVAETNRRATDRNLKRHMNLPDRPIEVATVQLPATPPRPLYLTLDAEDLAARATADRMELLELELQLAIDALTIDVTKNQKLPRFSLGFSYTHRGVGDQFSRAMDSLYDGEFGDLVAEATLEMPLGNEARRARHRRAMLQRVLSLATREQRRLAIRQEVLDALDQLTQNWQLILEARRETLLAARLYEAERRQFIAGVRTSTDVLEAADFLADAQIREIDALAAYEVAKIEIAFATGALLGHSRVRLVPYGDATDGAEDSRKTVD